MTVVSDWYHTIPNIIDTIVEAKPASILDVGMSLGKYGLLIRETLDTSFRAARQGKTILRVDGLELLRNHRSRLQEVLYNQIYYLDDISSIKPLPTYDAILLGDVLPKLEKEFGYQLIDKLLHKTKKVLIATAPTFARRSSTSDVSRWWELDFTEFDAEIFRVSTGSSDHRVFKIYPSSRRTLQIPRRVRGTTVKSNKKRPLNIAYCVPHKNLTGGVKTLLDQMKQLRMRGHRVAAVYQGESHERAVPGWADVEFDEEIVISRVSDIQQLRGKFDVIIAGWVQQLPELVESKIPLFYFKVLQGYAKCILNFLKSVVEYETAIFV